MASADVWDLCAGTGAVGLEALSWGASHCVFVDRNPGSTALIRSFLREHGAGDSAAVITGDIRKYITPRIAKPDLVFVDPPYGMEDLYRWIEGLQWHMILKPGGAVFVEYGSEPVLETGWELRRYGDSYLKYLFTDGSE